MATITVDVSPSSIAVSKTSGTSTISWICPSVSNITSCVLSGTITYTVIGGRTPTFTINGTTVKSGSSINIDLGTSNTTSSVSFAWSNGNGGTSGTLDTSNLKYIVTYTLPSYTVRFLDWNGDVLDTQIVEEGENATPPDNPVRDGYKFTGWLGSYTNITANTDIIAQYEEIVGSYNIYVGSSTINNVYLGNIKITKVYLGDNLIYEE